MKLTHLLGSVFAKPLPPLPKKHFAAPSCVKYLDQYFVGNLELVHKKSLPKNFTFYIDLDAIKEMDKHGL